MTEVWEHGRWSVKDGCEEQFAKECIDDVEQHRASEEFRAAVSRIRPLVNSHETTRCTKVEP